MSAAGLLACPTCGCGESGCTNSTGCTGSRLLTNCANAKFVVPAVSGVSGSITIARSYFDDNAASIPDSFFGGLTNPNVGHDGYTDYSVTFTFGTPTANFRKPNGGGSGKGLYVRYRVNANTYTFDAMSGTGVSHSLSQTLRSIPDGTVTGDGISGVSTASFDDGLVVENEFLSVDVGPGYTPSTLSFGVALQYAYASTRRFRREWQWRQDGEDDFAEWQIKQKHQYNTGIQVWDEGTSGVDGIGAQATVDTCAGDSASLTIPYELATWHNPSVSGDIISSSTSAGDATGTMGSATVALASSFDENDIGCRDLPRVLNISGSVTHIPYEDGTFDPEIGEFPELGNGISIGTMSVSGRLVQSGADECGFYNCEWGGEVEITPPVGEPYIESVALTRIGPSLWRLDGLGIGPTDGFRLKFGSDSPTGTATVLQYVNPHENLPAPDDTGMIGGTVSSRYQESESNPSINGYYTGFDPPVSLPGHLGYDDIVYTGRTITLDPNYDSWITGHAFTFTAADPEEGDPLWVCDDPCESDWTSYPETLTASLVIDGTPTVIELTRISTNPGAYQGSLDHYLLLIGYDGLVATLAQLFDLSESDEIPISTWKRYCASDGQGPIGTYVAASLTPNTLTVTE